jgi:hypothetical protein
MSISMERFGLHEQPAEPNGSGGLSSPQFPNRLQCRACGFEPLDVVAPPRCPKCFSDKWERYAVPGSLLIEADLRHGDASGFRHFAAALRLPLNPNKAMSCCDDV